MIADDDERKEWDFVKTAALEAIRPEVTPDIARLKPAPSVTQRLTDGETSAVAGTGDNMAMWQQAKDALAFSSYPPNPTGIYPTEYKVLIEPKGVETKIGSIIVPVSEQEKQKWATTEGTLIAVSPLAFTYAKHDEWKDAGAAPPKPGDRVIFAKYAGNHVKGKDGKEYVLANDKDVMAVLAD